VGNVRRSNSEQDGPNCCGSFVVLKREPWGNYDGWFNAFGRLYGVEKTMKIGPFYNQLYTAPLLPLR
jgi:hypothetical protein